jgi:hypothetical protein
LPASSYTTHAFAGRESPGTAIGCVPATIHSFSSRAVAAMAS